MLARDDRFDMVQRQRMVLLAVSAFEWFSRIPVYRSKGLKFTGQELHLW